MPIDLIQYASTESESFVLNINGKKIELPQFEPNETIAYVVVTSADTLSVRVGEHRFIKVDEGMLNSNKKLNISKVKPIDLVRKWKDILDTCREGVKIQFLFTRSSDVGFAG
jgi:hypothetical protein